MADEVKAKRPVPPQFLKKKKAVEQLPDPPAEIQISEQIIEKLESVKEIDMQGLIRDLMLNKYFHIFEKEARPIAEKMVKEGSQTLLDVKWFLAYSERHQLANELKEKYGLS